MLQGSASALWRDTAAALRARGLRVCHVTLGLGDRLFWRGPCVTAYRGTLESWERWLEGFVDRNGIDDIVYFADCLPYHRAAATIALRRGIRAWTVENGYLRPDWLTLEPIGMGRYSRFTRDPERIRVLASTAPAIDGKPLYSVSFVTKARCEMAFHLAHAAGRLLGSRYTTDRPVSAVREYLGWVPHLARAHRRARDAASTVATARADAERGTASYAVVALQMETDYQIRVSSAFAGQTELLELVILSFARRAPATMRLIVKVHPFDNNLIDWWSVAAALARRFGVADRVTVIRGGRLDRLLERAAGLVTINSTTAVHAFRLGCPVLALGDAVYDMAGLTHRSGIDRFWSAAERPCPELVDAWCRVAAAWIQISGHQMDPAGRAAAAAEIARRIDCADTYWRLWRDADGREIPVADEIDLAVLPAPSMASAHVPAVQPAASMASERVPAVYPAASTANEHYPAVHPAAGTASEHGLAVHSAASTANGHRPAVHPAASTANEHAAQPSPETPRRAAS